MNDQLKHFARDENNQLISGDSTFCKLKNIANPSEESYKHIFLECASSIAALNPVAIKFNITLPDMDEEGEKVIYFFIQDGKWNELEQTYFTLYINTT